MLSRKLFLDLELNRVCLQAFAEGRAKDWWDCVEVQLYKHTEMLLKPGQELGTEKHKGMKSLHLSVIFSIANMC